MMIPQISSALSNGFTSDQVIDYLLKKFPKHAKKIQTALAQGFTVDQVLKFLAGGKKAVTSDEISGTQFAQTRERDIVQRENIMNKGNALAGMGATAIATPLIGAALTSVLPGAQGALQRAAPQLFGQGSIPAQAAKATAQSGLNPLPSVSSPSETIPNATFDQTVHPSPTPPVSVNQTVSQLPNIQQPQVKTINAAEVLDKAKSLSKVKELIKSGNDPEQVSGFFRKFHPGIVKEIEKEAGQDFENVINSFVAEEGKSSTNELPKSNELVGSPEIRPKEEEITLTSQPKDMTDEEKTFDKGSLVSTPQGIGEIKELRNGKALIDIDGKKHEVDEEELEGEPEDVVQEISKLLKIPEVDRSSVVSLFTYDPVDKQMFIQFHNGDTTKYLDVDPEKVFKIANKMGIPVTQGKNIFGAWSPEDKKSLGATLIKELINDPKYKKAKKGEEPNPNYRNLETLYDYWQKLRKKPKRKRL